VKRVYSFLVLMAVMVTPISGVSAQSLGADKGDQKPVSLRALQNVKKKNKSVDKDLMPLDIRLDALRDAAFSYGARGGLAWRTYEIREQLESKARYLDKVFDFRQLLIPAQSGLLIEPPIIGEAQDAMLIEGNGLNAAVADRVFNIGRNARIVSAPRTWRVYLERQWGELSPPPDVLRPETREEQAIWRAKVKEGWLMGIEQADDIFQDDLNQLVADYQGMIRYRTLLAQKMVSPPTALMTDRGVTGGGNEMRVGDRSVKIESLPALKPRYEQWQPANR